MDRDARREQQSIDALEALRAEFRAVNPDRELSSPKARPAVSESVRPTGDLIEAWARAVLDLDGTGPESRRWGRSIREAIQQAARQSSIPECLVHESVPESDLARRLERFPRFAGEAAGVSRWIAAGLPGRPREPRAELSGPEAADLARAWRAALPGLRGLRAWRFLEHLGYPVVAPEAAVRRLLFRFGAIEPHARGGEADAAAITSAVGALSRLAGIEFATLRLLLRWASQSLAPWTGGGWCAPVPRCGACPLASACLWARYQKPPPKSEPPSGDGPLLDQAERLRNRPMEELSDAEVLALVIRGGRGDGRAVETASNLIARIGELPELEKSESAELEARRGIGRATARQIKAALELGRRVSTRSLRQGSKIQGSEDVWAAFGQRFRHISQEHFIVLLLDTKNRFITHRIVSRGTLDSSAAHPREVFREAIRSSASAVILMHNHPSGDPQPSAEDRAVTRQLVEAGAILGIRVLDHIILGATGYTSFRDRGEM